MNYQAPRPCKGEIISINGTPVGVVTAVEGSICYYRTPTGSDCFIWYFKEINGKITPNHVHDWPSRTAQRWNSSTVGLIP